MQTIVVSWQTILNVNAYVKVVLERSFHAPFCGNANPSTSGCAMIQNCYDK